MFLALQGVEIIEGDVWGHRKDIDEYYSIDETVLEKISALSAGGASDNEIAIAISRESKLSPELVKYLVKQRS